MRFFVAGIPQPKGSKTHVGDGVMLEGRRPKARRAYRDWCDAVGWAARAAELAAPWDMHARAYTIAARFYFLPPVSRGAELDGYAFHDQKPDVDKLLRCVLDAITGILVVDDKRIAHVDELGKWYHATRYGAEIDIRPLAGPFLPATRRRRAA